MGNTVTIGNWRMDPAKNRVVNADASRDIHPAHMRVLLCLAENAGRPVAKADLLERGWQSSQVSEDNLAVAVSHLRKALDDDLDNPALIRAVGDKGFELHIPVPMEKSDNRLRNRLPRLALLVLIIIAVYLKWRDYSQPQPPVTPLSQGVKSLAFLPIEHEADDWFARGYYIWLMDRMTDLRRLEVKARASAERASREIQVAADSLKVDAVLLVDMERREDLVILTVQLIGKGNERLWTQSFEAPRSESRLMGERLLRELTAVCRPADQGVENSSDRQQIARNESDVHFSTYLRGLYLMDEGSLEDARGVFADLVEKAPGFAPGFLKLAQTRLALIGDDPLVLRPQLSDLKGLLSHALYLDADLAEAHLALGNLQFFHEWDFAGAEESLDKALVFAPNRTRSHQQMARIAVCKGDFGLAARHVDRLKQLDPIGYPKQLVAWIYNMSRRFEDALGELALLENESVDPNLLHGTYVRTYENMDREDEAFRHYLILFERGRYNEDELEKARRIFAESGLEGVNRWLIEDKWEEGDIGQFQPPLAVARYCAGANDKEHAFYWLNKALELKQTQLLWIRVDPKYDTLRSDPRFQDLVDRMFPND
ncbi:MAG: winged helix-turn-helix domain-containing protein [Acidobacteriota bacterium]|nr:winged helix-turn-helix domain-containing protein [Acidobacteriota bacterium]